MDIMEELEIEEYYLSEERTTLIYMITGISYAALGLLIVKIIYDFGLKLFIGEQNLALWLAALLIVGGVLVTIMQVPKLIYEEKKRRQFELDHLGKDLKKELGE